MIMISVGERYSCNTLFGCMGYYSYENPNRPQFPGQERFKGRIVHPQMWDKECDEQIKGTKVALVGSGGSRSSGRSWLSSELVTLIVAL